MKVAFFGASVTAQSGEGSYVTHLKALLPQHEILQFGFGACHFDDAGFHKLRDVLYASPARVILEWNTTGQTAFNLLKLGAVTRQIVESGAVPSFLILPRRDSIGQVPRVAEVQVREFCRRHQVPLLDLVAGFQPDGLLRDMVHTTPEGAAHYAQRIAGWLSEAPTGPPEDCHLLQDIASVAHPVSVEITPETRARFRVTRLDAPLEELVAEVVVGPNMVDLQIEVGGRARRVSLVDRWCYYERRMFHRLWEGRKGEDPTELEFLLSAAPEPPDYSVLEKPRGIFDGRPGLKILGLHFAGVDLRSVDVIRMPFPCG